MARIKEYKNKKRETKKKSIKTFLPRFSFFLSFPPRRLFLSAAGIIDFLGVDTDRLAETARIAVIAADRTRAANFFSHVYYLQTEIEALQYQSIQR